ncbi:MAG TPA: formimidoylglutamate deiminase [Pseudonocardiaceae bacterium]|nr:formimidoylglutamate deiminase [Pseudonocardiaceae bacterium]
MPVAFWCPLAWLDGGTVADVLVSCDGGTITSVEIGVPPPVGAVQLAGMVFPGFANAHSHAFHRALRGRTNSGGGTFWTWREAMYQVAGRLDPDSYHGLARLVYAEMVLAGFTCVGEFHYLHHAPGGARYADPNAMAAALIAAAADAGIRLTLLDTCYLTGGLGPDGYQPLAGPQQRFGDGDVAGWASRMSSLRDSPAVRIGAAVHSVRAVPASSLPAFVLAAADRPVHVHLSEQPAENAACQAHHACSPTELLAATGVLGPGTTAVHATHLSADDIASLGSTACFCPTTEADLADGIGPARALADAGCPIALGTDQHVSIDPFAELRGLEGGARLSSGERGRFTPTELVTAATVAGHRCLGWPLGGQIAVGAPADLVAVRTDSCHTAGATADEVALAASASDVDTVVVAGKVVVRDGCHESVGAVGPALSRAIGELVA